MLLKVSGLHLSVFFHCLSQKTQFCFLLWSYRMISIARFTDHGTRTKSKAASRTSDGGTSEESWGAAKEGGAEAIGCRREEEAETGRGKGRYSTCEMCFWVLWLFYLMFCLILIKCFTYNKMMWSSLCDAPGALWVSDAEDIRAQPEGRAEAEQMVLGRSNYRFRWTGR